MDHSRTARRASGLLYSAATASGKSMNSLAEGTGIPRTTLKRRLSGQSPMLLTEFCTIADEIGADAVAIFAAASMPDAA